MEYLEESLPGTPKASSIPTEHAGAKKRKRPSCDYDGQPALKYLELSNVFTLDHFCDEVLIEVFKNLDTQSLLALEETCARFSGIVQDHRLWCDVDLLGEPKTVDVLKKILKLTTKKTKSIKICGLLGMDTHQEYKDQKECLMKLIIPKCEQLKELELHGVWIDFSETKIEDFPKNLTRLVFKQVSVQWPDNAPTVFQKMDKTLLLLEELRIESCTWFHPYDIMLFSKCQSLKKLSLRGCQNLSDFVPYGSMASRFGFKKLEMLDIRDTPINDSDLQCFNSIRALKELRLQCPTHLRGDNDDSPPSVPLSFNLSEKKSRTKSASSPSPSSSGKPSTSSGSSSMNSSPENAEKNADKNCESSTSRQPRESAVITIDMRNNTRIVILDGRVCEIPESEFRRLPHPDNPQGHFGSLLRHPHFWDMIDRQSGPNCGAACPPPPPQMCPISNRGISCFGSPANPVDQNVIWIRIGYRPSNNKFVRLLLRYYKRITDATLRHLVQCSPRLIYLDVTGTGVTQKGVNDFKAQKPECEVVCDHFED